MISFELAEPKTLNEAIALLDAEDPARQGGFHGAAPGSRA